MTEFPTPTDEHGPTCKCPPCYYSDDEPFTGTLSAAAGPRAGDTAPDDEPSITVSADWVRQLFESAQYTICVPPIAPEIEWLVRDLHGRLTRLLHERSELEKRLAERDAELDRLRSEVAALRDDTAPDDALADTLRLLDAHGCTNLTRGRCLDDGSLSRVSFTGTADQWCDARRAHDALQRAGAALPCGAPTEWDRYGSPHHWCARPRGHQPPCAADPFTLDAARPAAPAQPPADALTTTETTVAFSPDLGVRAMTEFNVGDRVLVPGMVTAGLGDGVNVELPRGEVVHLNVADLRPGTGGRDLTAQDTETAWMEAARAEGAPGWQRIADRLNRIARGEASTRAGDTAPAEGVSCAEAPWGCDGECCQRAGDDTAPPAEPRACPIDGEPLAAMDAHRDGVTFYRHADGYGHLDARADLRAAAGPRAGDTAPDDEDCSFGTHQIRIGGTVEYRLTVGEPWRDGILVNVGDPGAVVRDVETGAVHRLGSRVRPPGVDTDAELFGPSPDLVAELDRLRSEVAELRDAGNELAGEVEARDTPLGPLAREVQAWRSAAGEGTT